MKVENLKNFKTATTRESNRVAKIDKPYAFVVSGMVENLGCSVVSLCEYGYCESNFDIRKRFDETLEAYLAKIDTAKEKELIAEAKTLLLECAKKIERQLPYFHMTEQVQDALENAIRPGGYNAGVPGSRW